ncbi:MAG: phosphoribosylanthranilate isomerase [Dehalococcoidia bacterium]
MTRIKICGCMHVEDALAARDAGADFVGLVFAPKSRRRLTVEQGRAIVDALGAPLERTAAPNANGTSDTAAWFWRGAERLEAMLGHKRPLTVGVFEDQSIDEVNAIVDACGLDLIQLSGREPWDVVAQANRPVIKAVEPGVGAAAMLASIEPGVAAACMLDVSRGRGIAVDRELAAAVAKELPVWLAGGLTPENVSDAVRDVRPWAVDVSSGVETGGAKDPDKIGAFVKAALAASSTIGKRRA